MKTILVLPGDGIGPEITEATLAVMQAAAKDLIQIRTMAIGEASLVSKGSTFPDKVLEAVPAADGVLLGPVSHYTYPAGQPNPSATLRTRFNLFANIRPCRSRPDLSILRKPMDLIIVRENTEGFYADRSMHMGPGEFMPDPDSAFSIRKITAAATRNVAQAACELASARSGRLTVVHKANVLKLTDGLFLREVRAIAAQHPGVTLDEVIVDAAAALLIRDPARFDVIVTTNMFGDILSDEASELSGSLGLGGSINAGEDICVGQAQHGSAPDIAGQGIANPTSLILSAAMLLDWMGRRANDAALTGAARRIEAAVDRTLDDPRTRTRDIGGMLGTAAFADAVVQAL
ncbi:isocitrate/isopropylmalate family dehydrogenase [Sphingomonas sp. dw_22]|uniref:isocitrate/isopropylmalate dehydrogenase family protein n=1 Tax=Sphingomonas sp. dw_22 TaxID=2721175 RepID=UPI001BD64168|nr:isocitrate/isopropylmalate family dehydrogenase [Sphingomonas sp. dw_22]